MQRQWPRLVSYARGASPWRTTRDTTPRRTCEENRTKAQRMRDEMFQRRRSQLASFLGARVPAACVQDPAIAARDAYFRGFMSTRSQRLSADKAPRQSQDS